MLTKQNCKEINEYCAAVLNLLMHVRTHMCARYCGGGPDNRCLEMTRINFRAAEARWFSAYETVPAVHYYIGRLHQQVIDAVEDMDIVLNRTGLAYGLRPPMEPDEKASKAEAVRVQQELGETSKEVALLACDWRLLVSG